MIGIIKTVIEKLGVIGGGQLGRMMVLPAKSLGYEVTVLEAVANSPAAQVGAEQIVAPITDPDGITELAERSDVVTWEIEHVGIDTLISLQNKGHNIQADPNTLKVIQDKLLQKDFLTSIGVSVAPYSAKLDDGNFLGGGPYVVKSRQGGFDGRGNLVVANLDSPRIAETFGDKSTYAEQIVPFDKELSVIAARDTKGKIKTYPTVETIHENNICHTVISPAEITPKLAKDADEIAQLTLKHLAGAGVFAIEMFVVGDKVLVNEIAPRVHNSGHHTIESNITSQFEQHVRAVTGLPLGKTEQIAPAAVMVNILGTKEGPLNRAGVEKAVALSDTHVHFYGKTPRLARKIGHITSLATTRQEALDKATRARNYLEEL